MWMSGRSTGLVLMDSEIEYVNPEDAIEGGTRKGLAEMRTGRALSS
jgi:hypothetical protein